MSTPLEVKPVSYFVTELGVEVPAITAEQMAEVDRIAAEKIGPNLFQMMENAGRNLAEMALQIWGKRWDKVSVVVLAGGGANGGGGICAARHLANHGIDVRLCLAQPDRLQVVPDHQHRLFQLTGGREIDCSDAEHLYPDLIIDALIGYRLRGAPQGLAAELIRWANTCDTPILSLDVPSGVDATSGETAGVFVRPQWTLTLALPKTGLLPELTGDLWLADLGIPEGVFRQVGITYTSPFGRRFRIPLNVDESQNL